MRHCSPLVAVSLFEFAPDLVVCHIGVVVIEVIDAMNHVILFVVVQHLFVVSRDEFGISTVEWPSISGDGLAKLALDSCMPDAAIAALNSYRRCGCCHAVLVSAMPLMSTCISVSCCIT